MPRVKLLGVNPTEQKIVALLYGAILDALGFRELGSSGADYGYAVHLSTDREPMGITVLYTYEGAVPQRNEERYRQIAMRG